MRKLLVLLLVLILIVIGVLALGGSILSPYVHKLAVEKLNATGMGKFTIEELQIPRLWPLEVKIKNLQAQLKADALPVGLNITVPAATILVRPNAFIPTNFKEWDINVSLAKPTFQIKMPEAKPAAATVAAPKPGTAGAAPMAAGWLIHLIMKVVDGTISVSDAQGEVVTLRGFDLQVSGKDVLNPQTPKALQLSTLVHHHSTNVRAPLKIKADELFLSPGQIKTENLKLDVAGLQSQVQGASQLATSEHQWQAQINLPDLSALTVPPEFLPAGKWSGGLQAMATYKQSAVGAQATLDLETRNLQGDLQIASEQYSVRGLVAPKVSLKAAYTDQLKIDQLSLDADLTALAIQVPKLFDKPEKVPLAIKLSAQGSQESLQITTAQVLFHTLMLQAQGQVALTKGKNSQLQIKIPVAVINGLENLILPLKEFPLTGQLALQAQTSGDLFDPAQTTFDVTQLELQNVRGGLNFQSQDQNLSVKGPFLINITGAAQIKNLNLSKANMQGAVELSGLNINQKDTFQKKAGEPLSLQLALQQVADATQIKNLNFKSDFATLLVNGRIVNPQKPTLDIKTKIQKLNLGLLAQKISALKASSLSGQVTGELGVKGVWDGAAGIEKSPLVLTGALAVQIPKYVYQTAPVPAQKEIAPTGPPPELPAAQALLPNWPVLRDSQVALNVSMGELEFDKLKARQVQLQTKYNRGQVSGSAQVGQVFKGVVRVPAFSTSSLFQPPVLNGKMNTQNLSVVEILNFITPQYAGHLTGGVVGGALQFTTTMPQTKGWLEKLTAQGDVAGTNIQTKDDIIEKALGDKLAKFAQEKKALSDKPQPINADLNAAFSLKGGVADIKSMRLITKDDNEFTGAGKVALDLKADLKGTLYLSKVAIGGSVRAANSDARGRFTIPLAVKGSLLEPSFEIAAEVLEAITKRTLKYEASKATDKLKEDLGQRGDQLKKKGKEELKKQLKGLFK